VGFFLSALITVFIVVDPIAIAPLYLSLTSRMSEDEKNAVTRRSVVIAAAILVVFAVAGRYLLDYLGITVPAFYIAGGILLLLIAIDMLFARPSRTRETPEEEMAAIHSTDISVFPLAIPILAGPGAIATVVLYMRLASGDPFQIAAVFFAIAASLGSAYITMRSSGLVVRYLGRTGIGVTGRVMGILLAALAVQFVLTGIANYAHQTLHV